ncbi:MAG: ATP-dependent helicase [Thaumarchaeota archaeon]|nr:ATP-dependent helicase [Nitrososphaerota archaeon]
MVGAAGRNAETIRLTDEQERVVGHGGGPLLVNGGPGSGKTRVIVERVARLVSEGIARPENIFCMTFTKKAAGEMSRRLKDIRDATLAQQNTGIPENLDVTRVWVGTIHSLGMEILKENSDITGVSEGTSVFDSLSRLAWCFKTADSLGIDQNVIRMNAAGCAKVLRGIQQAKRELLSVEKIKERMNHALNGKERAGLNGRDLADLDESAKRLNELVKVYEAHEKHMADNDMIDYEGMVGRAADLLYSSENVRGRYHNAYVIVDEFQDNNYAQFQLATLLAGSGNIMVVGDRDQSIMEFQGAYSSIFQDFEERYPGCTKIDLEKNHRCSDNVRAVAGLLKECGTEPAVPHTGGPGGATAGDGPVGIDDVAPGVLGPANTVTPADAPPNPGIVAAIAPDETTEREFVAAAISGMVRDGTKPDVAVLCRTNAACRRFAEALQARGVLVEPGNTGIPMGDPQISEILALLHIAASPETSGSEIALVLERRGIGASNIRTINCAARRMSPNRRNDRVFEALRVYEGDQGPEVREIRERLEGMHADAAKSGLPATLHDIMLKHTDAYRRNANESGYESARNRAVLGRLYDMAERYNRHYPYDTLLDFVEYAKFASGAMAADPGLLDSDSAEPAGGVSVLTIHKSKGKEFRNVFVTGLHSGANRRNERDVIPAWALERDNSGADASEQNLLYVAMTRAQAGLCLTCPLETDGRSRSPLGFLDLVCSKPYVRRIALSPVEMAAPAAPDPLEARIRDVEDAACRAVRESRLGAAAGRLAELSMLRRMQGGADVDLPDSLGIDARRAVDILEAPHPPLVDHGSLSLSASKITTYQRCPLQFKYRYVLHVPERPAMPLDKGRIVHKALEGMGRGQIGTEEAIRAAQDEMEDVRCSHAERDYKHARPALETAIRNYVAWEEASPVRPQKIGVEEKFETTIGGVRYTGKIDRVESYPDGTYRIVDFKTGSSNITIKSIRQDGADHTIREPQACIYAHAAGEKYGSLPAKFAFVYVEQVSRRNGCTTREYDIDAESLQNGIKAIEECTQDILAEAFGAKPDGQTCRRCPYQPICPDAIHG